MFVPANSNSSAQCTGVGRPYASEFALLPWFAVQDSTVSLFILPPESLRSASHQSPHFPLPQILCFQHFCKGVRNLFIRRTFNLLSFQAYAHSFRANPVLITFYELGTGGVGTPNYSRT